MKTCPKCKTEKELTFFAKDSCRVDKLDAICKACRKQYRQQNKDKELERWKRNYAPGTEQRRKAMVRSMTRKKHGQASNYMCVKCKEARAEEWHHIIYKIDGAVPLCHVCHENI